MVGATFNKSTAYKSQMKTGRSRMEAASKIYPISPSASSHMHESSLRYVALHHLVSKFFIIIRQLSNNP